MVVDGAPLLAPDLHGGLRAGSNLEDGGQRGQRLDGELATDGERQRLRSGGGPVVEWRAVEHLFQAWQLARRET